MSAVTALPGGLVREHCGSRQYQTRYEQRLGLRPGEIWHDRPAALGDLIQGDASLVRPPDGLALSERGWWVVDHQPPMLGCVVQAVPSGCDEPVVTVGERVEGGETPDDYDTGVVVGVDGLVTVAWDSGVTTTQTASVLRPEGSRPISAPPAQAVSQ